MRCLCSDDGHMGKIETNFYLDTLHLTYVVHWKQGIIARQSQYADYDVNASSCCCCCYCFAGSCVKLQTYTFHERSQNGKMNLRRRFLGL